MRLFGGSLMNDAALLSSFARKELEAARMVVDIKRG
jgi:hypothetical protein